MKVAFTGCSLTRGDGFDMVYLAPEIWPNIISRVFEFNAQNLAISGASNLRIFHTACQAILTGNYDLVFCQWTQLNRLWLSPGPDTWYFVTGDQRDSFEYGNFKMNLQQKTDLEHTVAKLNHDYQNIMELVDYVLIIQQLADAHQVKIAHINGLLPWTPDLAKADTAVDFSAMSDYTRELLDFDQRNDAEIKKLFVKLHDKFSKLEPRRWINLFDSFENQVIDTAPRANYPGPRSHVAMSNLVRNYLKKGIL